MKKLKIIATSDFHGNLPEITEPFDILLFCGDVSPVYNHTVQFQHDWFIGTFLKKWVNNLPFKDEYSKLYMVPGNHDFFMEDNSEKAIAEYENIANGRLKILINQECVHKYMDDGDEKTVKIFGTPYCKQYFDWAFMEDFDTLKELYDKIPTSCDILISHDAPALNGLGMINKGFQRGIDASNKVLANAITEKKPKYVFCGHIHSGNHEFTEVDGIHMANVSYIDESYKPAYEPLIFEADFSK